MLGLSRRSSTLPSQWRQSAFKRIRSWRLAAGGTLAEPLRGFGDQLSRNLLVVKQNTSLAEQGSETGRIVEILGDGFMLAVADVDQPVCDADHFLSISPAP